MEKPARNYIKRNSETVSILIRVDQDLKNEIDTTTQKLDTSVTRFVEAAIRWYLDQLKKEGSI